MAMPVIGLGLLLSVASVISLGLRRGLMAMTVFGLGLLLSVASVVSLGLRGGLVAVTVIGLVVWAAEQAAAGENQPDNLHSRLHSFSILWCSVVAFADETPSVLIDF